MQCFESEVARIVLFALCREVYPGLARDELLLDEVLSACQVDDVSALFNLGQAALTGMVWRIAAQHELAA